MSSLKSPFLSSATISALGCPPPARMTSTPLLCTAHTSNRASWLHTGWHLSFPCLKSCPIMQHGASQRGWLCLLGNTLEILKALFFGTGELNPEPLLLFLSLPLFPSPPSISFILLAVLGIEPRVFAHNYIHSPFFFFFVFYFATGSC